MAEQGVNQIAQEALAAQQDGNPDAALQQPAADVQGQAVQVQPPVDPGIAAGGQAQAAPGAGPQAVPGAIVQGDPAAQNPPILAPQVLGQVDQNIIVPANLNLPILAPQVPIAPPVAVQNQPQQLPVPPVVPAPVVQAPANPGNQSNVAQPVAAPAAANLVLDQSIAQNNPTGNPAGNWLLMAAERSLFPSRFSGAQEENAPEFLRRLKNYFSFNNVPAPEQLRLAKVMLTDVAQDWAEECDPQPATFAEWESQFRQHFIQPAVLRFRHAHDIFSKKQQPTESVDDYAIRMRSLAKRVDIDSMALLYAFVAGLKKNLSPHVMAQNPGTLEAAINAARIAEIAHCGESSDVSSQLSDLRKDVRRLADRYDTSTAAASISAAVQPSRPTSGQRQFNRPQQRQFGPRYFGQIQQQYAPQQRNFRMPGPRQFTSQRFGRGGMRQAWQPRQQMMGQQAVQQQFESMDRGVNDAVMPDIQQMCGKCGLQAHANALQCPALNQVCYNCSRPNHFARACRMRMSE